jgi:site-specific DNA recombinase
MFGSSSFGNFGNIPKLYREKVAIYLRVSHEDQVEKGQGLEYQEDLCRKACDYKGYEIYDIYKDEGISGITEANQRPGMKRLLKDAHAKNFQHVISFSIDRISRRGRITMEFYETMEKLGIQFSTYKEHIDTSTFRGKFLLSVFAYASEMELYISKDRARLGREHRKLKDGENGGRLPYGYIRQNKSICLNPKTVPIVRAIYDLYYKQNVSMNKIANFLNEENIETGRNGKKWYSSTIKSILQKNYKKYRGEIINNNNNDVRWPIILEVSYDRYINHN